MVGKRGFDQPCQFGAYHHTLRGNSVLAIDPKPFQAPFWIADVNLAKPSFTLSGIATFLGAA